MSSLDGKVAIVTGAGRGIGRAHALALAERGARVVVNDLGADEGGGGADLTPAQEVVKAIENAGGTAVVNGDDVASWDEAERLVRQAIDEFGRLDILVNNAGILRDGMSFNLTEEQWDSVVRVHLKGHFAPTRFAAAHWRERSKNGEAVSGRIVNTSSESGLFANPGQANYGAAKSGIATMTAILARELERYGVTVNAIAPRARTRLTADIMHMAEGDTTARSPTALLDAFDYYAPENVAPMVCWLASDEAADVSGQVFVVGGGDVFLLGGWHVTGRLHREGPWSVEDLQAHRDELFGDTPSGVPPFAVAGR